MTDGKTEVREPLFLDRTYKESMALLLEARDYMATQEPVDRHALTPAAGLRAMAEGLRVTTRLSEAMAWSLTQKAVWNGEITAAEAALPRHRLGSQEVCLDEFDETSLHMPPRLMALMRRSLRLYQRVQRLDRLVAQHALFIDLKNSGDVLDFLDVDEAKSAAKTRQA